MRQFTRDDPQRYTAIRETDARTAMTRGLREYLGQLRGDMGGRPVQFRHVFETWAEPEDVADYPSAAVYSTAVASYEASKLTPQPSSACKLPDGRYLVATSEMALDITIEIWATDPAMRMWLVAMVEDGLSPLDYMHGLLLELPHYHSERASFEMLSMTYADSDPSAIQRYRVASIVVRGNIPVVRVAGIALARPKIELTAIPAQSC